jgi:hypothetical protein
MDTEHLEAADLPQLITAIEQGPFLDYSVGICRLREGKLAFLGTGVLIKKGGRCGILTAHHCLHACVPSVCLGRSGGDELFLVLRCGHSVRVKPEEAVERVLVQPHSAEFGPDLTFIEILAVERRGSLAAIGSFFPLDGRLGEIVEDFGKIGTPIVSIGFPEEKNTQRPKGTGIALKISAMLLGPSAIQNGDISEKDGWDYVVSHCNDVGSIRLPTSFRGFSGGPVWGMKLRKHKLDGHITIENAALIGINFYEMDGLSEERLMRAHFIKSIYDLAWKNLS